jgi:DNA topoisomerase-1
MKSISVVEELLQVKAELVDIPDLLAAIDELIVAAPKKVVEKDPNEQMARLDGSELFIKNPKTGKWVSVKKRLEEAKKALQVYNKDHTLALRLQLQEMHILKPGGKNPFWPEWKPATPEQINAPVSRGYKPIPALSWNVWINPDPNGQPVAKYRNFRGKEQQIDHKEQEQNRDHKKFSKLKEMMIKIPEIRAKYRANLAKKDFSEERVMAGAILLMDQLGMRPGADRHLGKGTQGAATMLVKSIKRLSSSEVEFSFVGKAAVAHERVVEDPLFAKLVYDLTKRVNRSGLPEELAGRLFIYKTKTGLWRRVMDRRINIWMKAQGLDGTGKDFRTFRGNKLFMEEASKHPRPKTMKEAEKAVNEIIKSVAKHLGNTPAVAKRSYINPAFIDAYLADFDFDSKPKVGPKKRVVRSNEKAKLKAEAAASDSTEMLSDEEFIRKLELIEDQFAQVGIDPDDDLNRLEGLEGE